MNKTERKTILKALDRIVETQDNLELFKNVNIIRGIVAIDEEIWKIRKALSPEHLDKLRAGRDRRKAIIDKLNEEHIKIRGDDTQTTVGEFINEN